MRCCPHPKLVSLDQKSCRMHWSKLIIQGCVCLCLPAFLISSSMLFSSATTFPTHPCPSISPAYPWTCSLPDFRSICPMHACHKYVPTPTCSTAKPTRAFGRISSFSLTLPIPRSSRFAPTPRNCCLNCCTRCYNFSPPPRRCHCTHILYHCAPRRLGLIRVCSVN